MLARGVSRREIGHRIERRRLHVVQRGVYAVGHDVLSEQGKWMAAALCAGGAISHRTAGTAWEILSSPLLEVTAPRSRRRPGLRIYCHCLEADEVVTMDGIPVTTVARTLLDLAVVLPPEQLERAVNEAEVQRLLRPLQLQRMLGRYPRRHGTPALSAILDDLRTVLGRDSASRAVL